MCASSNEDRTTAAQDSPAGDDLRVANLRKAFQTPEGGLLEVLRDVSFSVARGETIAITGASGAGKSTLLNLLGGLEVADRGAIRWNRLEALESSRRNSVRAANLASFIFQFHYLLADLTALENVALPLMVRRTSRRESLRQAANALRKMKMADRLQHKIGSLSGGEQQRVAVARALITNPELVLADEPTGNLDAAIAEEIGALLVDYSRRQRAVVIIATHNEQLAALCDRLFLLREGRIMEQKHPGRVVS